MMIIGCDYHPGFQQIAWVDTDTGELSERRLLHREEAEQFYHKLQEQRLRVRVSATVNPRTRLSLARSFFTKRNTNESMIATVEQTPQFTMMS
jgi:hypothetical protein